MTEWGETSKAPKGAFRVIGTDTFPWPHEDYWVGDYADLAQAKKVAESEAGAMNLCKVYDEDGNLLFIASTHAPR